MWVEGTFGGPRDAILDDVEAEQLRPRPPHDLDAQVANRVLPQLLLPYGLRRRSGIARAVFAHAVEFADDAEFLPEDARDEHAVGVNNSRCRLGSGSPRSEAGDGRGIRGALAAPVEKVDDAPRRRDPGTQSSSVEHGRDSHEGGRMDSQE
ncbi:hypothetical protein [Rhodococcus phenolicus]|uniref:hypothetical protein n=1 Tax=Rhodococcus phenolicus TaxID=263849 RepID=UPI00082D9038|nr:hypothetical protein [Rhodococcus phenolicus]